MRNAITIVLGIALGIALGTAFTAVVDEASVKSIPSADREAVQSIIKEFK